MAKDYKPADLSKLQTYSIGKRAHKFDVRRLAGLPAKGVAFRRWLDSLPPYLGAEAVRKLAAAIRDARHAGRPVVFALGAHVVKVGCSPIVCDLIERGIVTAVAMNGATAIHDVEDGDVAGGVFRPSEIHGGPDRRVPQQNLRGFDAPLRTAHHELNGVGR